MEVQLCENFEADKENLDKRLHEKYIKTSENHHAFIGFLFAANGVIILSLISFLQLFFANGVVEINSNISRVVPGLIVFTLIGSFVSIVNCVLFFNHSNKIYLDLDSNVKNANKATRNLNMGIIWFAFSLFSLLLAIWFFLITHLKY